MVTRAEDSSLLALISGLEDEDGRKVYSPKWRRRFGCGGRAVSLERIKCVVDRLLDMQSFQDPILLESLHGSHLPLTPAPTPACSLKSRFLFVSYSFNTSAVHSSVSCASISGIALCLLARSVPFVPKQDGKLVQEDVPVYIDE